MREEIPQALDGERIDRVAAIMTGLSRSAISNLITDHKILHNEEIVISGAGRVLTGDRIEVEVPQDDSGVASLVGDPNLSLIHNTPSRRYSLLTSRWSKYH